MKLVVGLTGPISGGKGVVAEILKEKGFFHTSLSDRIREEVVSRGERITRERLQDVADELRAKYGSSVLAERTWQIVKSQSKNAVIDSIRNIGEVEFFKQQPGFVFIGVTAPRELRFKRAIERSREGEAPSWEEFVRLDEKDFKSGKNGEGRDIQACLENADFLIENTGTLEELRQKIEDVIKKTLNQ